jgi:hypothetical protein
VARGARERLRTNRGEMKETRPLGLHWAWGGGNEIQKQR